jgi:hypothetical protein
MLEDTPPQTVIFFLSLSRRRFRDFFFPSIRCLKAENSDSKVCVCAGQLD